MKKNPVFVVVFIGSAVKLISSDPSGFTVEEQKSLKEVASIISTAKKERNLSNFFRNSGQSQVNARKLFEPKQRVHSP